MTKSFLTGLMLCAVAVCQAQSSKQVQWVYSAKKVADKTYEIHMTATIAGDYHLYAQDAGGEGPEPTLFTFVKNPLVTTDGAVQEKGALVKKFEPAWGHDLRYYEKTVDFVQKVKIKGSAKVTFSGKVEFMVCNDRQCLPPSSVDIKLPLGG